MTKTIMYNDSTKDCTATTSKPGSNKFEKLIRDGYKPVGQLSGFNAVVNKIHPKSEEYAYQNV